MIYLFILLSALLGSSPLALAGQVQDSPFVIVELFSSEGCSSCPPADGIVGVLTTWAREHHEAVYPVVFHVDYWDNLGWKDRFSAPEFSQRQYNYSRILKDQGVYTPQIIVNGADAFVGSDQEHLQKDIDHYLTTPAAVILHVDLTKDKGQVIVHYQAYGCGTFFEHRCQGRRECGAYASS